MFKEFPSLHLCGNIILFAPPGVFPEATWLNQGPEMHAAPKMG